uniref:Uncharacterized protein n=1 Tax=Arundo donax TaxID=35708 RepID=A0A0A9ELG4_ARUDO
MILWYVFQMMNDPFGVIGRSSMISVLLLLCASSI